MKIVTAANCRMRRFVSSCIKSVQKQGYPIVVYDLGGLGIGKPFEITDPAFQKEGYYHEIIKGRRAPGCHKPAMIKDCLRFNHEFIIYLDADTLLMDKIDELAGDYDIGLTVRPEWEVKKVINKRFSDDYFIYDGYVNNGVMCFNATEAAHRFIEEWEQKTRQLYDDQAAINAMLQEYFPLKSGQIIERQGIKIRTFDTMRYNYYYFNYQNYLGKFTYNLRNNTYLCPNHKELAFSRRTIDKEGNNLSIYQCPTPLFCRYFKSCTKNPKGRTLKVYDKYIVTEDDLKIKWQEAKILHFKGKLRSEYSRYLTR